MMMAAIILLAAELWPDDVQSVIPDRGIRRPRAWATGMGMKANDWF